MVLDCWLVVSGRNSIERAAQHPYRMARVCRPCSRHLTRAATMDVMQHWRMKETCGAPRNAALFFATEGRVNCSFFGAAAAAQARHVSCMRRRCPSCSKHDAMICRETSRRRHLRGISSARGSLIAVLPRGRLISVPEGWGATDDL